MRNYYRQSQYEETTIGKQHSLFLKESITEVYTMVQYLSKVDIRAESMGSVTTQMAESHVSHAKSNINVMIISNALIKYWVHILGRLQSQV